MEGSRDVLVVDDDDDLRDVIQMMVGTAGYPTRAAANGRAALEEVRRARPGLILLDMLMPVMDGWEFVRQLRELHGNGIPIVIVSAAEHVLSIGAELDAAAVLAKPFEYRDLLLALQRHLGVCRPLSGATSP